MAPCCGSFVFTVMREFTGPRPGFPVYRTARSYSRPSAITVVVALNSGSLDATPRILSLPPRGFVIFTCSTGASGPGRTTSCGGVTCTCPATNRIARIGTASAFGRFVLSVTFATEEPTGALGVGVIVTR